MNPHVDRRSTFFAILAFVVFAIVIGHCAEERANENDLAKIVEALADVGPRHVRASGFYAGFPPGLSAISRDRENAIPILIRQFGEGNGNQTANIAFILRYLEVAEVEEQARKISERLRNRRVNDPHPGDGFAANEVRLLLIAISRGFKKVPIEEAVKGRR